MKWLSYIFTVGAIQLFRFIPFSMLYMMSDGLAFLLRNVIGYRKRVVMDNLKRCFPEKTDRELEQIAKGSYRNLADIILESVKAATLPLSVLNQRYTYHNTDAVNQYLDAGRSVILTGSHYNNWEWGVVTMAHQFRGRTLGIYKPMSNPYLDRWFFNNRSRGGKMILIAMKNTFKAVEESKNLPSVFVLMSDQMPSNRKTAIAARFFNQPTACLPGTETIARTNDFPVLTFHVERIRRGFYQMHVAELCPEPAATAPGQITQQFMVFVEQEIRSQPENWLWSHKRWKWTPEVV